MTALTIATVDITPRPDRAPGPGPVLPRMLTGDRPVQGPVSAASAQENGRGSPCP
jgi:hypothetical protein